MSDESDALAVAPGKITCGDRNRRKIVEQLGLEDDVTFIGEADEAGRQAEEGDHLEDESADVQDEPADPYREAYADE